MDGWSASLYSIYNTIVEQNNNNETKKSIKRESDTRKFAEQDLSAGAQRRRSSQWYGNYTAAAAL